MQTPRFRHVADLVAQHLDLIVEEFVGAGAFKETYRATTGGGDTLALKVFDPAASDLARAEREVAAMRTCSSPNLAKLMDLGSVRTGSDEAFVYVVEEYLSGGTLERMLVGGQLPPSQVRQIGLALTSALAELDRHHLVHRDIKPENVMFRANTGDPVLVDLGLVRHTSRSSLTPSYLPSGPGTPFFASPEQLNNEKALIDWRSDQFCLGLVMGLCLTGKHPFMDEGMSPSDVVDAVAERRKCAAVFAVAAREAGLGFLGRMISPWPIQRFLTPTALAAAMQSGG